MVLRSPAERIFVGSIPTLRFDVIRINVYSLLKIDKRISGKLNGKMSSKKERN